MSDALKTVAGHRMKKLSSLNSCGLLLRLDLVSLDGQRQKIGSSTRNCGQETAGNAKSVSNRTSTSPAAFGQLRLSITNETLSGDIDVTDSSSA